MNPEDLEELLEALNSLAPIPPEPLSNATPEWVMGASPTMPQSDVGEGPAHSRYCGCDACGPMLVHHAECSCFDCVPEDDRLACGCDETGPSNGCSAEGLWHGQRPIKEESPND